MRLDKLLADMQAGTRSDVKRLIKQGAVTVDGSNKVSPKQQVDPAVQKVCCLGEEVRYQEFVYYLFYFTVMYINTWPKFHYPFPLLLPLVI